MPFTDQYERLPLSSIRVNRESRQRRVIEVTDLMDSIRVRGVMNPVIVQRTAEGGALLVAGERRLEASRLAGLQDIPVRWTSDLSSIELQLVELEENIKRKDLPWQDLTRAVERLHSLRVELDSEWTMAETAQETGYSPQHISHFLRVGRELGVQTIAESSGFREAYNKIARRDARAAGNALEELLEIPAELSVQELIESVERLDWVDSGETTEGEVLLRPSTGVPPAPIILTVPPEPVSPILHASFLDWAPQYSGPKFNLLHCDFPYGRSEFSGPQMSAGEFSPLYDSGMDTYLSLLESMLVNLDRVMSLSSHLMFWCGGEIMNPGSSYAKETWKLFSTLAPSLEFRPFPLIWVKSDNSGIAADPRHGPRHVYETCLLASRSARQIVRVVADAYSAPTDRRLHPSTKPEPMLRHFMSMLVDEHSSVLDPTAGSGAALRAADSLGAARVLGLEIDLAYVEPANVAWRNARMLRVASREA